MTSSREILGNIMKSYNFTINGSEYSVLVLNAQHCYHGCCFAIDWTGRAATLPELFTKFRSFVIRRQSWEKSA